MSFGGSCTPQQYSQMFVNKIKIVGTGTNRTVTSLEPFYLLESEWNMTDDQITGATNLIDHYGLKNAYQKYFRGNLKEDLSGFLTHLSGNVNTPASNDESGLMHLIERPPIQGKSFQLFNNSQLDSAVRLHPGPLPQEFMSQFIAPSTPNPSTPNASANGLSSIDAGSTPTSSTRKRRRDVHRSGLANSVSSDYAPASSFSHFPSVSSNPASSIVRNQQQQVQHHHHHHPPSAALTVSSAAAMAPHSGPLLNPSVAASLSGGNKPATSGGYFATLPSAVNLKRPTDDVSFNSSIASGMASSVESPGGYEFDDEIRRKKRRKEKKSGSASRRDRVD
ncbi:hypothetical protein Aperf_G00000124624 [Anoplocephala perfoliata]